MDKSGKVRHDNFHKAVVLEATAPFGTGEAQHAIERGEYFADVWFEPAERPRKVPPHLALWNKVTRTPLLVEVFRKTPTPVRLTDVVAKTLNKERVLRGHRRQALYVGDLGGEPGQAHLRA